MTVFERNHNFSALILRAVAASFRAIRSSPPSSLHVLTIHAEPILQQHWFSTNKPLLGAIILKEPPPPPPSARAAIPPSDLSVPSFCALLIPWRAVIYYLRINEPRKTKFKIPTINQQSHVDTIFNSCIKTKMGSVCKEKSGGGGRHGYFRC